MRQYGILAYPAAHSRSPLMHNAAFKAMNIDAYYGVFEKKPEELEAFMREVLERPIDGLSVSLPYKESILKYLDQVEPAVQKIGAVNTVVNKEGKLYGFNTDWIGSNRALIEVVGDLTEKIVVILGAGGAARAVAYGALLAGAHVWIKNRTKEKADAIAVEFAEFFSTQIHSVPLGEMRTGDILINTTSGWTNGMEDWKEEMIADYINLDYLANYQAVMDIVYTPLITPLLETASEIGVNIITGDKMLLYQACEQFKLWTGEDAPLEVMSKALEAV